MLSLVALITAQARPFLIVLSHLLDYYLLHILASHLDYLDVDKIEAGVVDARIVEHSFASESVLCVQGIQRPRG